MSSVKKVILVSAEHLPYHSKWLSLANEIAKELGTQFELKLEDYIFAIEHGKKDEFGMAGLPQLFVETADNRVHLLLWEIPLGKSYEPDFEAAKSEALKKVKEII